MPQALHIEEAQVFQQQSPLGQAEVGADGTAVRRLAGLQGQALQGAGGQFQAEVQFEGGAWQGGVTVADAGSGARQAAGQVHGRADAVVDAGEAVQQRGGDRAGLDQAEQGSVQGAGQAVSGLGGEALGEGLGRDGAAQVGGQLREFVEGGVGVGQPAEGEGLDEGGAGKAAAAPDQSGGAGSLLGFGG